MQIPCHAGNTAKSQQFQRNAAQDLSSAIKSSRFLIRESGVENHLVEQERNRADLQDAVGTRVKRLLKADDHHLAEEVVRLPQRQHLLITLRLRRQFQRDLDVEFTRCAIDDEVDLVLRACQIDDTDVNLAAAPSALQHTCFCLLSYCKLSFPSQELCGIIPFSSMVLHPTISLVKREVSAL